MDINNLEKELGQALERYRQEAQSQVDTCKGNKEDMEEIFRQTFYTLGEFKDAIIKYLKDNK